MPIEIKISIPGFGDLFVPLKNALKQLKNSLKRLLAFVLSTLKKARTRLAVDLVTKKWRGLIVLALSVGTFFLWGLSSALLWLLFLLFLVYVWESRIITFFALVCLAACPFLISFGKDALAEATAVYAFFFLVMTVFLQLAELIWEGRSEKGKNAVGDGYENNR